MKLYDLLTVVDSIQPIHLWYEKVYDKTKARQSCYDFEDSILKEWFVESKTGILHKLLNYEVVYVGTDLGDNNYLFVELKNEGDTR